MSTPPGTQRTLRAQVRCFAGALPATRAARLCRRAGAVWLLLLHCLAMPALAAPEDVMLTTRVQWLDAPGGAADVGAPAGERAGGLAGEPVRPGMRLRVTTHWRYGGSAALPRRALVIDASVPRWLRYAGNASHRRGAEVQASADGFDFADPDALTFGGRPVPQEEVRAVRWTIDAEVDPGEEGDLAYDAVTR